MARAVSRIGAQTAFPGQEAAGWLRKHNYESQQRAGGVIDDRVRRGGDYPDMRAMHSQSEWDRALADSAQWSGSGRPQASTGSAARPAGRQHPVTSETHNHSHSAYGAPDANDDGEHSHSHHHAGDGSHAHEHVMPDERLAPGAQLDRFPWARSWSSFLAAVADPQDGRGARAACRAVMDRTRPRASGGLGERVPSEGGFLVPERLRAEVLSFMTEATVRPRASVIEMDSLRVPIPFLDNPSQGSSAQALGGLTFSFVQEGSAIPATTPNFGRIVLEARKLAAYMTGVPNELLTDSPAFADHFLVQTIAEGYAWTEDDYFIGTNGTGVGCPQGLINAPCAIGIDRNTASEVLLADVVAMYKQLHPASRRSAVWLIDDSTWTYLLEMYLVPNTPPATSGAPATPPDWLVYDPASGYFLMLGLPVIATDHQPSLGSTGDVLLADIRHYLIGDLQTMTVEISSRGAGWISDTSGIRVRSRVDGRYWIQSSTTTESGQVVIADRRARHPHLGLEAVMTMTTIEHRAPDRAITERIVDPAVKPAADLAGHLDQCLARLTGFSRGWPAVDYLRRLAAAMREGEKQALAEVGRARSLGDTERWEAWQILQLWRRDAPAAAAPVLSAVTGEWRALYGDDPVPPPRQVSPVTVGPEPYAAPGRELSPGAQAVLGKPKRRR